MLDLFRLPLEAGRRVGTIRCPIPPGAGRLLTATIRLIKWVDEPSRRLVPQPSDGILSQIEGEARLEGQPLGEVPGHQRRSLVIFCDPHPAIRSVFSFDHPARFISPMEAVRRIAADEVHVHRARTVSGSLPQIAGTIRRFEMKWNDLTVTLRHLTPSDRVDEAAWVTAGVVGFGESVISVVPSGFECYARIFHPATRDTSTPVRWKEVASAMGRIAHPGMQWPSLVGTVDSNFTLDGVWDQPPTMGSFPAGECLTLIGALKARTATPEHCWFGVWDGYGALSRGVQSGRTFDLPNRHYHLLEGPIDGLIDEIEDPPWTQTANVWWPSDRAWFVASEIDFVSTYVGGSQSCIDGLLQAEGLEVSEVEPADGVRWSADLLNPSPADL